MRDEHLAYTIVATGTAGFRALGRWEPGRAYLMGREVPAMRDTYWG
ncbi:MAG: hypothetical protein IRZ02_00575 [Acidothermus sp.]|nr:hypothetical protein [Acidothermus sp.]MCL6537025.1 hypothetical protein [Acidothermus sp.]